MARRSKGKATNVLDRIADLTVVDQETGEERLLIEIKSRPASANDRNQLIRYMQAFRVRLGLLIDPVTTSVVFLPSLESSKPEERKIPTEKLGLGLLSKLNEREMEHHVKQALQTLAEAARRGDYSKHPRELFPDVVAILHQGEILTEVRKTK